MVHLWINLFHALHASRILVDDDFSFEIQLLARQQAQREEELAQSQRHILALQVCRMESKLNRLFYPSLVSDFCFNSGGN